MKKSKEKNQAKDSSQMDLFNLESSSQALPGKELQNSKIISMADHKHQEDVKKFYDIANKLTSHLK